MLAAEQLQLDVDDLTSIERDAIAAEFLSRYSDAEQTNGALRAKPCACTRPLPLADEPGEKRCHWCGREPRR